MVSKTLDPLTSSDRRRRAGHDAEAQLAFYLKRAYEHDPQIRILNGIRLEAENDAAQLDHLVVYPYGMIVIESKSVYGEVKVNAQGEWSRSYRGRYQGMPSAKLQADRQVSFLRRYLEANAQQVSATFGRKPRTFTELPVDVFVAVSDGAIIHRPQNAALDYLIKAEGVPLQVARMLTEREPKRSLLGFKSGFSFAEGELEGVVAFLMSRHAPLTFDEGVASCTEPITRVDPQRQIETQAAPLLDYCCKHCQSTRLEVRWGHSYYFRCLACAKNTPISRHCEDCGEKERVRKEGPLFFGECGPCGRSEQFYTNPS